MTPPAEDPLDELYATPLADFVKTRDRQAGELRKQGDKARAAEIKALGKPTPAAWAVNQAARAAPAAVQRLLEASDRMARLQLRAGDPDSRRRFEEASADHRRTMDELVEQAARALRDAGHADTPAALERVANNLRWGALDEDTRPLITKGRLQRDLAPAGFGAFAPEGSDDEEPTVDLARGRAEARPAPVHAPPAARPATPVALRSVPAPPPEERPAAASPERGVLRLQLREAEKRVQQAERSLERRAAAVQAAQEVFSDLERRAAAARETLRAAEEARAEAEALLTEEEEARRAAADALERAVQGGGADSGKRPP